MGYKYTLRRGSFFHRIEGPAQTEPGFLTPQNSQLDVIVIREKNPHNILPTSVIKHSLLGAFAPLLCSRSSPG